VIGGHAMRTALIAGAQGVIDGRDQLNLINVFPVPDGDTGTNMAFTFASIESALQNAPTGHLGQVLRIAALAAIDGARGNSGAIVAQFFYGLSTTLSAHKNVELAELCKAINYASQSARRALTDPKEGTILSAMSAFAKTCLAQQECLSIRQWITHAVDAVAAAVARTPRQLAVLAEHNVVDAGAQGFLQFVRAIQDLSVAGRNRLAAKRKVSNTEPTVFPVNDHMHDQCSSEYRFCTECVLHGVSADTVKRTIVGLAHDSFVLAGGEERAHVHLHTNDPADAFERLSAIAHVSQRKADDMHAQMRAKQDKAAIGIVCDSAADLPAELIRDLNIFTVPVRINFGNEEFLDRITLNTKQFYARLRSDTAKVRTSQPPGGEFRRLFDQLASHYQHVICLTLSAKLSGTYQAALSASEHSFDQRTQVWDTHNAATGEALLIIDTARAAKRGLSRDALQERFERMRPRSMTYALIRDASFGVRGGRMPKWMGQLTKWLGLNIIVSNKNGKIVPCGVMIGTTDIAIRFTNWVLARTSRSDKLNIIIGHCDALEAAQSIHQHLKTQQSHAISELHVVEAGVGIGAHAGPSTLVLGIQRSFPWPEGDDLADRHQT
jgi:uncharacterized protein